MMRIVQIDSRKHPLIGVGFPQPTVFHEHPNGGYQQAHNEEGGKNHESDDAHIRFLMARKSFQKKQKKDQSETYYGNRGTDKTRRIVER
jgi:hypothetical protein